MNIVTSFLKDHSPEIVVGIVTAITLSIIVWCWKRWVNAWNKRAERRRLLDEFALASSNFVNNMPQWLNGNPSECFVLFPQGPKGVSNTIAPMVIEHVGKLQQHIIMRLGGFRGLFSFSKHQRNLMMDVYYRAGMIGASIRSFGRPILNGEPDQVFDIPYVHAAWNDLHSMLKQGKNYRDTPFLRAMRLRFRFFPVMYSKFAPFVLALRIDAKGQKMGEYFGPLDFAKASAA